MEAVAVDVPMVTLVKSPTEQKERMLRAALLFVLAFALAPLHSWAFTKWFERTIPGVNRNLQPALFRLPLDSLQQLPTFQHELKRSPTLHHLVKRTAKELEALRRTVRQAKFNHITADLGLEGALFSSIGFIKVLFGQHLTGNHQFSGEQQLASQSDLERLYKTHKQSPLPQWLESIPMGKELLSTLAGKTLRWLERENPAAYYQPSLDCALAYSAQTHGQSHY